MRKQFLFAACTLFAASALVMTSCQQTEEPIANDPTDQAGPMTRAATLGNFYRVVYVEVNDAGEYLLSDGTPFFTHVILFASNIRGDASGNVHNYNNPNNAAILANPAKYIAPLQAKGIKVIMGNLGDHTGAGFANLTATQIGTYTDDLVAYDNIVDGYDFDDEWAEYGTRGYPYANSTSYSNMIIALAGKTNKSISVFDWGNTGTLSSTAISHLDWGCQGSLNGYGFNSSFAKGQSLPLFVNLTGPMSDNQIKPIRRRPRTPMHAVSRSSTCPCRPIAFRRLTRQPRLSGKPLSRCAVFHPKQTTAMKKTMITCMLSQQRHTHLHLQPAIVQKNPS